MNDRTISVTAIGLVNHCYGWNGYYRKEENDCKEFKPNTTVNDLGIQTYLKTGISWKTLKESDYNTCRFPPLGPREYKPFSGSIPVLKQEQEPALYIYVKQPNIDALEKHIDPNFREFLGFPIEGIPEVPHLFEGKQNDAHDKQKLK